MYAEGRGVPQDYVQAHKWFNLATSRELDLTDRKAWEANRDMVTRRMTREQIADAQKLSREWKGNP